MTDYFCIFAGGGVRGTAYLGVLKALDEMGIKITGLAGSSVGAIFSALYAVGYTYEEMREVIFKTNYDVLKDLNFPFGKDFGFCKGENFLSWLKELIEKKYYKEKYNPAGNKPVTFKDLDKDLIIVATNISKTTFKEYSIFRTPDVEIVQAVRASISIPGFFKPVRDNDDCLVDGDIIVNFPIWTCASDLVANTNSRILEFRLESTEKIHNVKNPLDYFSAILDTCYNISTDILVNEYGHNDQIDIVRIDTGKTQVIDFLISNKQKERLIENGAQSVRKYFNQDLVKKKKLLLWTYEKINDYIGRLVSDISRHKIKDSQISMADFSLFLADNKGLIHQSIYRQILKIRKVYKGSLYSIKLFGMQTLRNKEYIILKLEEIQSRLEFEIQEMKTFLKNSDSVEAKEPIKDSDYSETEELELS